MLTKKAFDERAKLLGLRAEKVIASLIELLISNLYVLDKDTIRRVDKIKIKDFNDEAINYGDLHCVEVKRIGEDRFLARIEEAAPESYGFRKYLEGWLERWGWDVEIKTDW